MDNSSFTSLFKKYIKPTVTCVQSLHEFSLSPTHGEKCQCGKAVYLEELPINKQDLRTKHEQEVEAAFKRQRFTLLPGGKQ